MFTKFEKDVSVHQSLADEPNVDNGLSAEGLKKLWDTPAEELKAAFNKFIDEITDKSAARNIGAMPLTEGDSSGATVQDKLEYLLSAVQNVTLGQIPDGSITKAKLDAEYTNTLAVKDGEIQSNLNTEKLGGKTLDELASYFIVTGSLSDVAVGVTKTITLGFTPRVVIINSGATRDGNAILQSTQMVTTENPTYVYSESSSTDNRGNSLEIIENGFKFTKFSYMNSGDAEKYGSGYRYIAIR